MKEIKCPHCRHVHEHEDAEVANLRGSNYLCQGCGRKLRIETNAILMHCSGCGGSHECDDCIEDVRAQIVCFRPEMHKWQPTLAIDMEKCSNCYDIRRVPVLTPTIS